MPENESKHSSGTVNKREMKAEIIVEFLRTMIPHRLSRFRKMILEYKNKPVAVFNSEIRRFIRDNYEPEDRATIYKKLDGIPREIGGDDPWGYHIAEGDYHGRRCYKRTLYVANRHRKDWSEKWIDFKNEYLAKHPDAMKPSPMDSGDPKNAGKRGNPHSIKPNAGKHEDCSLPLKRSPEVPKSTPVAVSEPKKKNSYYGFHKDCIDGLHRIDERLDALEKEPDNAVINEILSHVKSINIQLKELNKKLSGIEFE